MESKHVSGKVRKVYQNANNYAFYIGNFDERISGFGKCPFNEGEEYEIDIEKNAKGYWNLAKQQSSDPTNSSVTLSKKAQEYHEVTHGERAPPASHEPISVGLAVKCASTVLNSDATYQQVLDQSRKYLAVIEAINGE